MKDCPDIKKLISAFSDGKLAPEDRARVEAHLKACPACARELADLAESGKVLKGLARVRATDDFLERVHGRLERPKPAERRSPFFAGPSWIKIPLEVAAAAGAVFLIYAVARQEPAFRGPPAAPALRMELPAKAEDAKSAPRGRLALKSVAESREAAEMDYAAADLPYLRVSLPPEADQEIAVGAARTGAGSAGQDRARSASAANALSKAPAAIPPGEKDRGMSFAKRGGAENAFLDQIAEAAQGVGGREIAPAGGEARALEVEIPLPRYEDFLRELGRIGEVAKPYPPSPPSDQETIRLRIEILPQR